MQAEAALAELEYKAAAEQQHWLNHGLRPSGVFYLNGIVDPTMVDTAINKLETYARAEPGKALTLNINSPGGSVMDGLALYDTIRRMGRNGHHITIRGTGLIASMATILVQAGDRRILDANASFLVHELSARAMGKLTDIEDTAEMLERLNAQLFGILAERATLSAKQLWNRAKRKEWWMDAQEALKLGFCDEVE